MKPQKVAGALKWRTPRVSRRKANVLRKKALRDGSYGSVLIDAGEDERWGRRTGTRDRVPRVLVTEVHRSNPYRSAG